MAASAEGDVVAGIVLWPVDDAALAPAYLAAEALAATAGREGEQPLVAALPGHVAVGFRVPARRTQRLAALLAPLLAPRPPARQALAAARESLEARAREDRRQGLARVRRQALLALLGPAAAAETLEARPSLWEAIRADEVARVLEAVRRETLPVAFAGPSGDASRLAAELETRVGQGPLLRPSAAPPPVTAQRLVVDDEQAAGGAVALAHALRFDRALADRHRAALALLAESLARGEGSLEQRLKVAVGPGVTSSVELLPAADGGGVLLLGAEVPQAQVAAAWKVLMAALDSAARQSFRRDAVLRARQRLDAAARQRRADAGRVLLEELLPAPAWHWPPEDRWKKPAGSAALLAAAGDLLDSAARVAVESGTSAGPTVALAGFPQPRLVAPVEHCGRDLPLPCRPPKEQRRELARRRAVEVLQTLGGRGADSTPPAYVARYTMSEQTAVGPVITEVEVEAGPDRARASWRTGEQILVVESSPGIDRMIVHGQREAEIGAVGIDQLELLAFREPAVLAGAVLSGLLPAEVPERERKGADENRPFLRVELAQGSRLEMVVGPESARPQALRVWWPGSEVDDEPDEVLEFEEWSRAGSFDVARKINVRGRLGARHYLLEAWSWSEALPGKAELPENSLGIE